MLQQSPADLDLMPAPWASTPQQTPLATSRTRILLCVSGLAVPIRFPGGNAPGQVGHSPLVSTTSLLCTLVLPKHTWGG